MTLPSLTLPMRMPCLKPGLSLSVEVEFGDIDHVVLVDGDAARPAELLPLGEELALLIEDLDAVVGAVGDEQASGESIASPCGRRTRPVPCPPCPRP